MGYVAPFPPLGSCKWEETYNAPDPSGQILVQHLMDWLGTTAQRRWTARYYLGFGFPDPIYIWQITDPTTEWDCAIVTPPQSEAIYGATPTFPGGSRTGLPIEGRWGSEFNPGV